MSSQRSARRYSESPLQDKHGQGGILFHFILLGGAVSLLTVKIHSNYMLYSKLSTNYCIRLLSNFEFMKHLILYYLYINTRDSCLKRENANHSTINYRNMIEFVVFPLFVIVFLLICIHLIFLNLLREKNKS